MYSKINYNLHDEIEKRCFGYDVNESTSCEYAMKRTKNKLQSAVAFATVTTANNIYTGHINLTGVQHCTTVLYVNAYYQETPCYIAYGIYLQNLNVCYSH